MIYLTIIFLAVNIFLAREIFVNSKRKSVLASFVFGILTIPITGIIASSGDVSNILLLLLLMSGFNTLVLTFISYVDTQLSN